MSPVARLASKVLAMGVLVAVQAVFFTLLALSGIRAPDGTLIFPSARLEVALAVAAVAVAMTVAALAGALRIRSLR